MPKLQLISESQQKKFDSCPTLTGRQRERYFALDEKILEYIDAMRSPINQVGFLVQLGYFRASGKFFPNSLFKVSDLKFCSKALDYEYDEISEYLSDYSAKVRSKHKKYILIHCGWRSFDSKSSEELYEELEPHAKQQMHPEELLPIATKYLINRQIELPLYYVIARVISDVYNKIEDKLVAIVDKALSKSQKDILDDLIWIDDKRRKHYKFSALAKIKQFSYSTKIKDIEESIKNYKLLKAFYQRFAGVFNKLNISESATIYYSEWVIKSKLFQLKQFKARAKAYLYLLAHLKHQYHRQTDLYAEIILKLIANGTNAANKKLEAHTANITKLQKKIFTKLANSHNDSRDAFNTILNILNDNSKNFSQKDLAIREIAIEQLYNNENADLCDDPDIKKYLECDESKSSLKYILFSKMAASLQRKLTPIIREVNFDQKGTSSKTLAAIEHFIENEGTIDKVKFKKYLSKSELEILSSHKKPSLLAYKGLFYNKVFSSIKAGEINVSHSYNFLSIDKYLIPNQRWDKQSQIIIEACGLDRFKDIESVLDNFEHLINNKFRQINEDYTSGYNKYLRIRSDGAFTVSTPKAKGEAKRNKLTPVFAQEGIIPIPSVLSEIEKATGFTKNFKHHSLKKVIMKPSNETIHAGIISKGCNHGHLKMANISKGISKDTLNNTINWFFSLENIQQANNQIINYINKLALPNIYKIHDKYSHTSSDGQKFNVGVDSILANYSFKYFGQSQGISVYTFIDDRHVLFYDTILSPGEREAAYVIDGLMANHVVNSHTHSTDTHGYSEVIFAVMHFLGVSFAPRIKKIGSQRLYSVDSRRNYSKQDYKLKPNAKINTKLIKENWDDILKLISTIKSKTTTASQIFKRLNSYTKETPLYKALKEFGRMVKTFFILTYADDVILRKQVEKQLNKVESSNKFARAVFFANNQEFRTGSTTEQKVIVACKTLIQNCIVLWNYLYLSQILLNEDSQGKTALIKTIKQGSIISWRHINLHGEYDFKAANDPGGSVVFDLSKIRALRVSS